MSKLFEAFFWIEPTRPDPSTVGGLSIFNDTKVLWYYPDDVTSITSNLRDIPDLCFPDLEKTKIENGNKTRNELFTFTKTEENGSRFYGICLRTLFRGQCRQYDAKRRPKHCLCFITRQPYFTLFGNILQEIHAITLLEAKGGTVARKFLELLYTQQPVGKSITIPRQTLPDLTRDFHVITGRSSHKEIPILPLFEALGVDRFMILLSAALCESRIIFVADEVDTLSNAVLAAAAMLHPFQWQHIFIPLLPSKLLSYAGAPFPYMIGVRRYLWPNLSKEAIDDLITVDIDSGDVKVHGNPNFKDFVGDSGSTLKQASENFDAFKAKASGIANMFLGNGSDGGYEGPKDVVAAIIADLRSILAAKPGGGSIQSVATGLLKSLPGGAKTTTEESRVQWALDAEKSLRDGLMQLFVYLLADMDFSPQVYSMNAGAASSKKTNNKRDAFGDGDSRAAFDLNALMIKRNQMGDTQSLKDFFKLFTHSQMFERFCDDKVKKRQEMKLKRKLIDDDDDFELICQDLRSRGVQSTVANCKLAVQLYNQNHSLNASEGLGLGKGIGSEFDVPTVQLTAGILPGTNIQITAEELESFDFMNANRDSVGKAINGICEKANNTENFAKIMNTITVRLDGCRASGCRGVSGNAGLKAMILLKHVLIMGPESSLSYAIDLIRNIRTCMAISASLCDTGKKSKAALPQALDFMSQGAAVDVRMAGLSVLQLILDHVRLAYNRRFYRRFKNNPTDFMKFKQLNITEQQKHIGLVDVVDMGYGTKQIPTLSNIHEVLKPSMPNYSKPLVMLSTQMRHKDFYDAQKHEFLQKIGSPSSPSTSAKSPSERLQPFKQATKKIIKMQEGTEMITPAASFAPSKVHLPAAPIDLLDDNNDDAKFRVRNIDTGDLLDIRDLEKVLTPSKPLPPKPVPKQGTTDPFSASWASKPSGTTAKFSIFDPFGWDINNSSKAAEALSPRTQIQSASFKPSVPDSTKFQSTSSFAPSVSKPNNGMQQQTFTPSQSFQPTQPSQAVAFTPSVPTASTQTFTASTPQTFTPSIPLQQPAATITNFAPTNPYADVTTAPTTSVSPIYRDKPNNAKPKDPFDDLAVLR